MPEPTILTDAHALVIGIGAYVHADPLPSAVRRGAEELAAALADPEIGGYPPEQVRLLLDGEARREAIFEQLRVLAGATTPESTVCLYFAGHGGPAEAGGEPYLLPVETDPARLAATAVAGGELTAAVAAIPARRLLVVFDCCHAGDLVAGGALAAPAGLAGGVTETFCEILGSGSGRVVMAAARGSERSWVESGDEPSVFTRRLLEALRGGRVRVFDLFEHVQPAVTGERPDQHPVFRADLDENFPVALALGRREPHPAGAADGFLYDAFLSYAEREPDERWVWEVLVPRLEAAGLAVAVAGDSGDPGVARVVAAERGILRARRTVVVLSAGYLEDEMTGFVDTLAQTVGLEEGVARLLPVRFAPVDPERLPARLRMLVSLDLGHPQRAGRNMCRLVRALTPPRTANVSRAR